MELFLFYWPLFYLEEGRQALRGLEKWDAQARALQAGGLDQSPCPWWASVYKSVQWADAVRGAEAG